MIVELKYISWLFSRRKKKDFVEIGTKMNVSSKLTEKVQLKDIIHAKLLVYELSDMI